MNKIQKCIERCDYKMIIWFRKHGEEFARLAFFIIFFWFGILKVFQISAAGPLVSSLLDVTFLGFIPTATFMVAFGTFEALLGVMALIPKLERVTFVLLGLHMITTMFPLFLLPEITWHQPFVPTLTGQYIMKNLALLGLSFILFAQIRPMSETHSIFAEEDKKA